MLKVHRISDGDIPAVIELLEPYVQEGTVLRRTPEEIRSELPCFFAAYSKNNLEGIVSYHDYDNHLYEIRSLVVRQDCTLQGTGKKLVEHVINSLKKEDLQARIFALTYVPGFFKKLNFKQLDKSLLPEKIWKDCNNCPKKDCCKEIPVIYQG